MTVRLAALTVVLASAACHAPEPTAPPEADVGPLPPPPAKVHPIAVSAGFQIYSVREDGVGVPVQMTGSSYDVAWSPAGSDRLAFDKIFAGPCNPQRPYVMAASPGAQPHPLVSHPAGCRAFGVVWSPGAHHLAFSEDFQSIRVVGPDGTGLTTVADASYLSQPAWSPDGQRLAYFDGDDRGIWSVGSDGTGRASILILPPGSREVYSGLQYSPDGAKLVMCHAPRESVLSGHVQIVNVDGSGSPMTLTIRCSYEHGGNFWCPGGEENPQWSPDGRHLLAVEQCNAYHDSGLSIASADGSGVVKLMGAGGAVRGARWSRDGTEIAFTRYDEQRGLQQLWVMAANGTGRHRIPTPSGKDVAGFSWGW